MNFGIICEFNPFHAGHAYLFEQARRLGAKSITCVMSGNSVQRGELAIFDKYSRAEMAMDGGADLVLELPFPWCSASAEYFAAAGIRILAPICDAVIFGSECGDTDLLTRAARASLEPSFLERFEARKKSGEGAASAYFSLLEESVGVRLSSNDLLGVEYIKASIKRGYDIDFYTVRREGLAYRDDTLKEGELPSATAVRKEIKEGRPSLYESCGEPVDESLLERAYLMYFRLADPRVLSEFAENEGGIAERIHSLALSSADHTEFWNSLRTKRYTDAKLRRAMLFSLTEVRRELLLQSPEYTYLLGANENGREILSSLKKNERAVRCVTKPADAPRTCGQRLAEDKLSAIFTLASPASSASGELCRKKAVIK